MQFIFGNQSIIGIFLVSAFLFFLVLVISYFGKVKLSFKIAVCILLASLFYAILISNSRAAWIGLIAGLFFYLKKHYSFFKHRLIFFRALIILFVLFSAVLFWYKKDSSDGRLLIYKVSAQVFRDNWLNGIGWNKFPATYNLYQSRYFSKNDIDGREALLADNTFYAFNDLWQLIIEIGIGKFLILLFLVGILLKTITNSAIKYNRKYLFYAAAAALMCIAIASLFSYPFHVFALQLLSLFLIIAILFSLESRDKKKRLLIFLRSTFLVWFGLTLFTGCKKIFFFQSSEQAFLLSQAGYKKEALNIYSLLQESDLKYGPTLYAYAKLLYNVNRLQEAEKITEEVKTIYTDNEVYKLSAAIAYEGGNLKKAERDYKTALYMVPNRMRSRYELFKFYLSIKDSVQMEYWGQSILNMSVKIPSVITKNIQSQTRSALNKIERVHKIN